MGGAGGGVFLSYRRADSTGHAGRLCDVLGRVLGQERVFRDVQTIGPGSNYLEAIESAIREASHVLVLVGPAWLSPGQGQAARLFESNDVVRSEIRLALKLQKRILPVLVAGARMPAPDQLPEDIRAFALANALELSETRWEYDTGRLLEALGCRPPSGEAPGLPWSSLAGLGLLALALILDAASEYGLRPGARIFLGGASAALGLVDPLWRKPNAVRWRGLGWLCCGLGLALLALGMLLKPRSL